MQPLTARAIKRSGTISLPIRYYFDYETAVFLGDQALDTVRDIFCQIASPPDTFRSSFRLLGIPVEGTATEVGFLASSAWNPNTRSCDLVISLAARGSVR